jgi:predicted alpha/beta-hydrolase family hydrolase
MQTTEKTSLSISGHNGQPIPNRLFWHTGGAATLAVIFPGLNYTCDMPLLYYPAQLFEQRGVDVLQVQADYTSPAFASISPAERMLRRVADAQAAVQAGCAYREYSQLVLVGKSIGTVTLAALVSAAASHPAQARALTVWITPLLKQPLLVEAVAHLQAPAWFACGTGDDTFDAAALQQLQRAAPVEAILIEGADHSLQIPDDIDASLAAMQRLIQGLAAFLDRNGVAA